jgi:quinone-modifying oxidoreductase subunit QmoB
MDKKIGAYICSGCGIGEALNIERLVRKATAKGAKVVKTHPCLCGDEGNALIAADVANEGVNTVVVAACSPRAMVDAFRLDVPILERVNLREHVVWSHEPKTDGTQELAEDYIAMGLIRLQKTLPPEPFIQETSKRILVVGGGLTGLWTAHYLASAFTLLRQGLLAEAVLDIRRSEAVWECPKCGAVIASGGVLRCEGCGVGARLLSGDEILLEQIEMEVP